jgi:hypothetical protein
MLRKFFKNSEFVRNSRWIFTLFILKHLTQFLLSLTNNKLRMIDYLLQCSIARYYISFNDFLKVFKDLIMNVQLVSNGSSNRLFWFSDINVNNIINIKLPGQCNIIRSFRWRSKDKIPYIFILKLLQCFWGGNILESWMINSSVNIFTLCLSSLLNLEIMVNKIIRIDQVLINIVIMSFQVTLFTVKHYLKLILTSLFIIKNFLNSSSYNMTSLNKFL